MVGHAAGGEATGRELEGQLELAGCWLQLRAGGLL